MKTFQEIPLRASANPALPESFDAEFDIVVVGGGGGGLPAALFARWLGNTVGLLEKAPELGGTAQKAAFWYWVPNNKKMQELGLVDRKEDFLRYVARLSRPQSYNPEDPRLGQGTARASPPARRCFRFHVRRRSGGDSYALDRCAAGRS